MKYFKTVNRTLLVICLTLFVSFYVNCSRKKSEEAPSGSNIGAPEKKNLIVLQIQEFYYSNSDFENYLRYNVGDYYRTLPIVSLSRLFDNFVEEKILLEAARNQEISLTWEEQKGYLARLTTESLSNSKKDTMDEIETKILFETLLIEKYTFEAIKDIEVKEEEIKEYYDLHKRDFLLPERVKVSQILLATEEKAVGVLERLKDSSEESFRKAALEESTGTEASKGGEMGLFEMGQLPFEMDKVIFSLKEGELSPVVESTYGYHIFRLDAKYGPELVSEEKAAPSIKVKILDQKIKEFISQRIEELKESLEWSVYLENLYFPYQRNTHE
ncbi:MAG: hypothetical protein E3J56_05700 [Candidatus Aminicenantes bacterium]|nr:MAG: hypothetical protein E3J56_05700 [Candidatus Aminicenantes bacterium]